ncbi:MAG TPA: cell envelope integrity protein TolA [Candidatus Binatia bacterium]|nr:cell envelope integrity protein TolA [Candidatus Binatia bacterium]
MIFDARHVLAALVLHGMLFALLAGGTQCSRRITGPSVIQATLVAPRARHAPQPPRKPVEEVRKPEPPPPKPDRSREIEQERRAEEQRKQSELVQKRKAEEERKKSEAEQRRRQDEEARRLAEEKRKAEEERKRQLEEQRKREVEDELKQRAAEEDTAHQLEREQQQRQAARADAELSAWQTQLQNHIERRWLRPPGLPQGLTCRVAVQLLPDGTVTSERIVAGSGNPAFDRSVEDAVIKASPLPLPADRSVFQRDLTITFQPDA